MHIKFIYVHTGILSMCVCVYLGLQLSYISIISKFRASKHVFYSQLSTQAKTEGLSQTKPGRKSVPVSRTAVAGTETPGKATDRQKTIPAPECTSPWSLGIRRLPPSVIEADVCVALGVAVPHRLLGGWHLRSHLFLYWGEIK